MFDNTDYIVTLYHAWIYNCCKHTLITSLRVNSNQTYKDINTAGLHDIVMRSTINIKMMILLMQLLNEKELGFMCVQY